MPVCFGFFPNAPGATFAPTEEERVAATEQGFNEELKPVSFRYNKEVDATQTLAFGLIAEEVAEVYPGLVGPNSDGEPESVRYEQINSILLNEFLKAHKAFVSQQQTVEQQQAAITRLEKQVEVLTACLQKVSAQLDRGRTAHRTVLNNQ